MGLKKIDRHVDDNEYCYFTRVTSGSRNGKPVWVGWRL